MKTDYVITEIMTIKAMEKCTAKMHAIVSHDKRLIDTELHATFIKLPTTHTDMLQGAPHDNIYFDCF